MTQAVSKISGAQAADPLAHANNWPTPTTPAASARRWRNMGVGERFLVVCARILVVLAGLVLWAMAGAIVGKGMLVTLAVIGLTWYACKRPALPWSVGVIVLAYPVFKVAMMLSR